MLHSIFTFQGRIGRLQFFLGGLALVAAILGGAALMGVLTYTSGHPILGIVLMCFGLLLLLPVFCWISLSLQARRMRDVGLEPVYAIPTFIFLGVLDGMVAHGFPALSMGGHGHRTIVGVAISGLLTVVLLFWPGEKEDDDADEPPVRAMAPPPPLPRAGEVPQSAVAMARLNAVAARPTFGKR